MRTSGAGARMCETGGVRAFLAACKGGPFRRLARAGLHAHSCDLGRHHPGTVVTRGACLVRVALATGLASARLALHGGRVGGRPSSHGHPWAPSGGRHPPSSTRQLSGCWALTATRTGTWRQQRCCWAVQALLVGGTCVRACRCRPARRCAAAPGPVEPPPRVRLLICRAQRFPRATSSLTQLRRSPARARS